MNIRTTLASGLLISTMAGGMALPQTAAAHGTEVVFGFNIGAPVVVAPQPAYVPAYVQTVPAYQPYYPYGYYAPTPVRFDWRWDYYHRHHVWPRDRW